MELGNSNVIVVGWWEGGESISIIKFKSNTKNKQRNFFCCSIILITDRVDRMERERWGEAERESESIACIYMCVCMCVSVCLPKCEIYRNNNNNNSNNNINNILEKSQFRCAAKEK